ncbi:MAG: Shedu immune nuclease family protein [Pseudomonadales bacterium]
MTDDFEYFSNKRSDRVYLSRALDADFRRVNADGVVEEFVRPFRIVSKVVDCQESHEFFKDGQEVSLRITEGQRQEIKAKFYEDSRGISTLQIQRYTTKTGVPHKTYFTFVGSEISILYNFIRNIPVLPLVDQSSRLDDEFVNELVLTREQAVQLIENQPDLIDEIIRHSTTSKEIALLGERKEQLKIFERILWDDACFEEHRRRLGPSLRVEDVWQNFFERNTWIFGYGLNYVFNAPLEGKKLEQVVQGYSFNSIGKRIDGLLKSTGLISSLSFGEIKTHKTPLLSSKQYRSGSWGVSDELAGGVAQVQRTVQVSIQNIREKTEIVDKEGLLTGEDVYLYDPKAFLVIGSLSQFQQMHGVNERQFSSFELFRRNLRNPEIVTFDELLERARYIVAADPGSSPIAGRVG